ncbi:RNA 2',3'-cyclic phosphodiesterase [Halocalculus aciditolerans]|uniref:RNA 2',3'-cyclic phosphodiesterase n=1 Tax=Halocalculus aciditolerans TaxID=1383812 RepID=A0A830FF05_9EURY|nr:RNA 2',3'-cyclic phosphodiesterase [Halocalculus aciditolerans]GGL46894.1 RNA 2',3'-cyclic phosphodiesterase [Halocalculus aciditolerans]
MRLFVSLDLSPDLRDAVATVQESFADAGGLSFTDPTQAHVTVKFLGDVDADRADTVSETVADAVEAIDVGAFDASFEGLGVFPSLDYISVVWLGVDDGSRELTRLHEAIDDALAAEGFEREDHEFTPHVTLARMQDARGKARVVDRVENTHPVAGRMRVTELTLTESTLTADGAVHETKESFPLTE